jgi:UDPglucose 6-dehydrogenase
MQAVYQPLIGQGYPILFTNVPTAELIKYASNAYLATKIAFANEVADICEGTGADIDLVIKGMGMDQRIGGQYMKPGPGFGGSCFPKDTLALTDIARKAGFPSKIVESVIASNDARKLRMVEKVVQAAGGDVSGKKIGVLGLTFKANTDDMRYSPSLVVVPELLKKGAVIQAYDPVGMDEAKKQLPVDEITWCDSIMDASKSADLLVIVTEWEEFESLPFSALKSVMAQPVIVDLRNLYAKEFVEDQEFAYLSVGR